MHLTSHLYVSVPKLNNNAQSQSQSSQNNNTSFETISVPSQISKTAS